MAISISGILSNSYVAYSKSIAFYSNELEKQTTMGILPQPSLPNPSQPAIKPRKKKSHKENWKNREQQKNKMREREKYTNGEQPVRRRRNSNTGERISRWLWISGWIISPLSKLSSNFLSLSQQFRLFSFSFYSHSPLT